VRYQDALQEELGPELTGADVARSTLRDNVEIDRVLESARNFGPEARTKFERLLAQEGGDAAQPHLGYFKGVDEAIFQGYTKEQLEALAEGENISDIVPSMERHHVVSVKAALDNDPFDIRPLIDENNIRPITSSAHRQNSEFGHGGNTSNPTTGEATPVQELYGDVVEEKHEDLVLDEAFSYSSEVGLAAGLLGGSISALVQYQKLRRKPWKRKALGTISAFAAGGIERAGLSYVAIQTSEETTQLISHGMQESIEVGQEVGTDVTAELIGTAASIKAAVALRSGLNFAQDVYEGRPASAAGAEFGKDILVVSGEELAFVLLGVMGDAYIPVGEPHLEAVVNGTRILYRIGKAGHKIVEIVENRRSRRECRQKRLDTLRQQALDPIPSN
jgi:hypothetical protein